MSSDRGQSKLRLRTRAAFDPSRLPLVMLPVAGGIALVVHILTGFSLLVGVLTVGILGVAVWVILLRRSDEVARARLVARVRIGLVAGLAATVVYDALRYGLVALLSWSLDPFHAWTLFGAAILGPTASGPAAFAVGLVYHLVNGMGFAVAFTLIIRRPTVLLGIAWGLALELTMALLYPMWMVIAQLGEFLTMSVFGHVGYGATLGFLAARLLARRDDASSAPAGRPR